MTHDPEAARKIAEEAIRIAAQTKDNPAELVNVAFHPHPASRWFHADHRLAITTRAIDSAQDSRSCPEPQSGTGQAADPAKRVLSVFSSPDDCLVASIPSGSVTRENRS